MNTPLSKRTVQNSSVIQSKQIKSSSTRQQVSFEDKRASTIQQQKIIEGIHKSSDTVQAKAKTPTVSSTGSNAVIQRYTILKPGDYQTTNDGQKPLFPSNQLESRRESSEEDGIKSVVSKRNWKPRNLDNPPLKVSEKGLLALESTVGQPKVFYGKPANIQASRQRLINIKSRITLDEEPGAKVSTPKNPTNPDGQTQDLIRVKPVQSPHVDPRGELMDTSVCTFVSERIVGGKHLVIGNKVGSQKVLGSVSTSDGNKFGRILNQLDESNTTKGFEDQWQNDVSPYILNNGPISQEVHQYFKTGILGIHVKPSDRILRALSVEGTPKELWKQVYEIYDKKEAENNNLIEGDVFRHIIGYFKTNDTIRYTKTKDNQQLTTNLGINEHTAPEVGESFSSFALPSPGTIDEKGITGDGVDLTKLDGLEIQQLIKEFLALQSSSEKLGWLAKSQYKKARGLVQFGDHHAAVVAKDGPDTVTFENYNRGVESEVFLNDVWEGWFTGAEEFRKDVNSEVREMLRSIRQQEGNPDYDNHLRKLQSFKKKKEALDKFQQDFIRITDQVRAKIETNIFDEQNDLWHFNMYGPANQTFVDENQNISKQSFHDVWSKSVPNTLTVRTTGLMDDQMKDNLRKKVYHLVYQQIKQDHFGNSLSSYNDLRDLWLQNIDIPKTRVEYSDTLISLQELEQSQGTLTPSEQFEAEALMSRNKKLIFTALYLMTNEHQFSPKKMFFKKYSSGIVPFG
ncbi:MAG: hypothetical protein K0S23_624 [Fluviicola sp.]|jgi:hypothetical protein|uniref:hypothetical protein n=1 Tax=Fluviicola sp. TaxID=1917219 RepID=UPI00260906CD|nr:hypothetical protein [Fluviicola sp.]MDF3026317.1 hypothetical protein [Fluviicola sp.]